MWEFILQYLALRHLRQQQLSGRGDGLINTNTISGKVSVLIRIFLITEAIAAAAAIMFLYLAGYRFYIVRSGSMEPFIQTGSIEIVDCRSGYSDIKAGEVVCFASAGGVPVIHRVASVTENGLETKGDANDVSDGITVVPGNYIGKAVFQIPYAGYAAAFAVSKKGRIAIITVIAVLLIITLFPVRKEKKERIVRGTAAAKPDDV